MGYTLITGASSGIGRELASLFAADGHDLVITARNRTALAEVKSLLERRYGVHVETFAIDLSENGAPLKLYDYTTSHGFIIDHLVNNAGFGEWTGFLDGTWRRQHEMMQLNMNALAELTYRYGRDMRDAGAGRILNVSSVASMMAGPYMAMYFASKAFVRSLSEAVAYELRGTGVTVTALMPGAMQTGFIATGGLSDTKLFANAVEPRQVAQEGYDAMMAGKINVISGLVSWQKPFVSLSPVMPRKALLNFVYNQQTTGH